MNIIWYPAAERDLFALADHIAEDSPQAALRIYNTIRASVNRLATFPYSGRAGRVNATRELIIPSLPYIVVYTIDGQEVKIWAVYHTSRKWPESFPTEG
jgi:toxin ParE1/3/4